MFLMDTHLTSFVLSIFNSVSYIVEVSPLSYINATIHYDFLYLWKLFDQIWWSSIISIESRLPTYHELFSQFREEHYKYFVSTPINLSFIILRCHATFNNSKRSHHSWTCSIPTDVWFWKVITHMFYLHNIFLFSLSTLFSCTIWETRVDQTVP